MTDWTTKPPTEPGWYWSQWPEYDVHRFVELVVPDKTSASGLVVVRVDGSEALIEQDYIEWWPIPIPEPPRKETTP